MLKNDRQIKNNQSKVFRYENIFISLPTKCYNDMSSRREKRKPQATINRQLEQPEVVPTEKDDNLIQLGKFFYSLAGMTYASAILAELLEQRYYKPETLYWGVLTTVLLTGVAWILIKIGNKK